jgi:hypothetical protein
MAGSPSRSPALQDLEQARLQAEELHADAGVMAGRLQQMESEAREQRAEHAQRLKQHQQIR